MSTQDSRILYVVDGPVATITLNRPESLNILDGPLAEALASALAQAEDTSSVRAVILRGAGPAFMAGGDLRLFHTQLALPATERRCWFERTILTVHDSIIRLRRMPKPVIASVQGACAGFGLSLMLACDLALAAEDALFTLAYSLIGTSPDGGATFHLPHAVGMKRAMAIALLADRFGAQEAEQIGLINRVVPVVRLESETLALAQRLAQGPTVAYARTKRLLNLSGQQSLETHLQAEAESFAASALTHDFAEGIGAFLEKRKPQFSGT